MDFEINSTNQVVKAVVSGTALRPEQFAAARRILPLPQSDLLKFWLHFLKITMMN